MVKIDLGPRGNPAMSEQTLPESTSRLEITPTLVVGLGGTGTRVLSLFKQRILTLCGHDAPVSYLGIDTDCDELPGAPLERDEFALAECMEASAVAANLDGYPAIRDWWHEGMDPGVIHRGAQMKRPVGRLACFYNYAQNEERGIGWRLDSQIRRLQRLEKPSKKRPFDVRTGSLRVYVVGSLSGGTGGGFFFDTALAVRDAVSRAIGTGINPIIVGVIVLPRGFIPLLPMAFMKKKVQANFYAGLKEIEYLSSHYQEFQLTLEDPVQVEKPPFDTIYLLDTLNQRNRNIQSTDRLHSMIASELCVEVYSSITGQVERVLVNMEDETAKVAHGKRCFYGSFATAALVIPGKKILDYCVLEYARERLNQQILFGKTNNATPDDDVSTLLTDLRVLRGGDEHLTRALRNAASTGMNTMVRETVAASKEKQVPKIARIEWAKLQDPKRGLLAARAKIEDAEEETRKKLVRALQGFFEKHLAESDSPRGIDYLINVARSLTEQLDILASDAYTRTTLLADASEASKTAKQAYNNTQKTPPKRYLWGSSTGQISRYEEFSQACADWSDAELQMASLEVARRLYNALHDKVQEIRSTLKQMASQLSQACRALQRAALRARESAGATSGKHDYVLIESVIGPEDFPLIFKELSGKAKLPSLHKLLAPKRGTLESWSGLYVSNLETLLNDDVLPAIEKVFAPLVGQMDILSAAEKYSDVPVTEWVKQAIEQCSPFCNFDRVKVPGGYYHETHVGVCNARHKRYQNAIGDVTPAKVVSTGNSNEILIHTMMTALPAFAVTGLERYRIVYEEVCRIAKKEPQMHVHLDRKWADPNALPDLFPDDTAK